MIGLGGSKSPEDDYCRCFPFFHAIPRDFGQINPCWLIGILWVIIIPEKPVSIIMYNPLPLILNTPQMVAMMWNFPPKNHAF